MTLPRLSRRATLFGLAGLGAAALGLPALRLAAVQDEGLITGIVRRHLPDLRIAEAELAAFADDYLADFRRLFGGARDQELLALRLGMPLLQTPLAGLLPDRHRLLVERFERHVVTKFLLSSDYLLPDRPATQAVTYHGFADPYASGCANWVLTEIA